MTRRQANDMLERIQMEYVALPGLALTFWQAQRLWQLSDDMCARALATLVAESFLTCTDDGKYVLRDPLAAAGAQWLTRAAEGVPHVA